MGFGTALRAMLVVLAAVGLVLSQEEDPCFSVGCSSFSTRTPHKVYVGAYINDLATFSIVENTVRFDVWLWIKWPICTNASNGTPFRPDRSLRLENVITRVDLALNPTYPQPVCGLVPGHAYYEWRVEGIFHQNHLSFVRYPLDTHDLFLEIEDATYAIEDLLYVSDTLPGSSKSEQASAIHKGAKLPGWSIVQPIIERDGVTEYKTKSFSQIYGDSSFSNYKFGVTVTRGAAVYLLKVLPPVIITLAISGMVLLLDIEAMDIRIGTAVTGLLTEVFLQLSFQSDLPQADYLTLLDWIFNLSFLIIFLIIVECMYIRKLYYRLLLQGERLKDSIVLSTLKQGSSSTDPSLSSFSAPASPTSMSANFHNFVTGVTGLNSSHNEDVVNKATETKRRKEKIKGRIRKVEKLFFVAFLVSGAAMLLFVTLLGKFA